MAGAGAVSSTIAFSRVGGTALPSIMIASIDRCVSARDNGSSSASALSPSRGMLVRLDNLLQKDKRVARVFAIGEVLKESSEVGVETPDDVGEDSPSAFEDTGNALGVAGDMTLTWSSSENLTARGGDVSDISDSSLSLYTESSVSRLGRRDGRPRLAFREEMVLTVIRATASLRRGIAMTVFTP